MKSFDQWMKDHQTEWRKANVDSPQCGRWRGREYPWILPNGLWEKGLWAGIRTGSNSLPKYLKDQDVQKHEGVHHLNSSWMLCANLYFPFRATPEARALFASFLKHHVAEQISSLEEIELEYAESGELHPSCVLGEEGGKRGASQTSPDLGLKVNGGCGLLLVEVKLAEHSFYECSAGPKGSSRRRPRNPDPSRCNHAADIVKDHSGKCHQSAWGRKYWKHLAPVADERLFACLPHCPASKAGYQLFRQQASPKAWRSRDGTTL